MSLFRSPGVRLKTVARSFRSYHSYQHPPAPFPYNPTESAILDASLAHVPQYGFSTTAMAHGARDAGYLDISLNLFPRGAFDLVKYHLVTQRLRLASATTEDSSAAGEKERGVGARIRELCVARLKGNIPYIRRWQEALAIMSLAGNVPASLSELAKLSDEMWFLAGDESADTSWYTKRAMLSAVYASTELFMTQDRSANFSQTWKFLDRRLGDVKTVGSLASGAGEYASFTVHQALNVLRSKNVPFF